MHINWLDGSEIGATPDEVQERLAVWLKARILEHEFVEYDTVINDKNRKWRVSSAMQKAIRRGDWVTAERMAWGLYNLEPEYCWRRLPVIAMEDIGIADIALVAMVLWVSGKAKWREQNGGDAQFLQMLVRALASSVKDRSVCDLVCWADSSPDLQDDRQAMFDPALLHIKVAVFVDPTEFLAHRMLAGWALAGTKYHKGENETTPIEVGAIQHVMVASKELGCPAAVQCIIRWASTKIGDPMCIAYPLIWQMVNDTFIGPGGAGSHVGFEPDKLVSLPPIGLYPSAAFDWHCREGKRALAYFNAACEPMTAFLHDCLGPIVLAQEDKKARVLATSSLLFRTEGSQVDRRLVFNGSRDLMELAELALNRACGIRGELNDHGMALMLANMEMMHWSRLKVLDMVPPDGGHKPVSVSVAQELTEDDFEWPTPNLMVSPEAVDEVVQSIAHVPDTEQGGSLSELYEDQHLKFFADEPSTSQSMKEVVEKVVAKIQAGEAAVGPHGVLVYGDHIPDPAIDPPFAGVKVITGASANLIIDLAENLKVLEAKDGWVKFGDNDDPLSVYQCPIKLFVGVASAPSVQVAKNWSNTLLQAPEGSFKVKMLDDWSVFHHGKVVAPETVEFADGTQISLTWEYPADIAPPPGYHPAHVKDPDSEIRVPGFISDQLMAKVKAAIAAHTLPAKKMVLKLKKPPKVAG